MSKGLIEVKVTGADKVQQTILALAQRLPVRIMQALEVEANAAMEESQELVPVMTGALKSSRFIGEPFMVGQDIGIVFGYGGAASAYALAVHENPRAGKTGGWGVQGPIPDSEIAFRWITRGGKRFIAPFGAQRKNWARGGQWKYLEQPVLARTVGFCERIRLYALGGH